MERRVAGDRTSHVVDCSLLQPYQVVQQLEMHRLEMTAEQVFIDGLSEQDQNLNGRARLCHRPKSLRGYAPP